MVPNRATHHISPSTQNSSHVASKRLLPYFTSNNKWIREIIEWEKTIGFVMISGVVEVD